MLYELLTLTKIEKLSFNGLKKCVEYCGFASKVFGKKYAEIKKASENTRLFSNQVIVLLFSTVQDL